MAVVSVLAFTLYNFLFYNFFDTERAANETQKAIQMISENSYIPDEKKDEIIQGMSEKMTTARIITSTLLSSFVRAVLLAVISALFVRKKEKINDIVL